MTEQPTPDLEPGQHSVYQIRIKGHIGDMWFDWFEGLNISLEADGSTLLTGTVADQSALHGVLKIIRDLGLPLLSVRYLGSEEVDRVN